jgi:ATP/maltotriose-dependent transcriptional regulator MalT
VRASDWYEANDDPRLAVEMMLKGGSPERAADLIERHITERWQTVDLDFHLLLHRLPFEVIASRPALCLQLAWLSVMFGQAERILPLVEAAEQALAAAAPCPPQKTPPTAPLPARCAPMSMIYTTARCS